MKIRLVLIFFISILRILPLSAQFYDIGQEPSSIKWKQIHSEHFKLIYPHYYESQAVNAARLFEQWRLPVSRSLKVEPPFTPIIFHTGSVVSNAYTAWAPRRIEFITVPPQDIYAQPWLDQLVLHEYRHIVQITKVNQGFTHFLSFILGQQAAPGVLGLFVPPWFLEGDAVATETALSQTGRGRVADFSMPLRAQLIDKGPYHYAKATLGSFRDFVPNEYVIGYHIVATARSKYGNDIWNSALNRTGRMPYTLNPFSKGIKLVSGKKKAALYSESMADLKANWNNDSHISNSSPIKITNISKKDQGVYTNYTSPFYFEDGIVALKSSLAEINHFVFIDSTGNEKKIFTPGFLFEDEISFNGSYISWAERRPHIRWENKSYATIVLLNPATKKAIRLTTNLMAFAPTVAPDNKKIAISEVTESGMNYLTFIDLKGNIIQRIPSPSNMFLSSPSWSPDGNEVVCILTGPDGKQFALFSFQDSSFRTITPLTVTQISHPQHCGNMVLFNMDVNEKSEVCSLDLSNGNTIIVTSSRFGISDPYIVTVNNVTGNNIIEQDSETLTINRNILIANYTSDGYRIAEVNPGEWINTPITFSSNNQWQLAQTLQEQERELESQENSFDGNNKDIEENDLKGKIERLEEKNHEKHDSKKNKQQNDSLHITNYSKVGHLFKFHSWAPVYVDVNDQTVRPGLSVQSQNLLSTMFITAGYDYNLDEETGQWRADIKWKGWYPEITNGISFGNRSGIAASDHRLYRFTWQETSWNLTVGQWLNFAKSDYNIGTYFEVKHQFLNVVHDFTTPDNFREGNIGALGYRTYTYILQKQAFRDLAPRHGISFDFHYKHSPYGAFSAGELSSAQLRFYLPGFIINHSFQIFTAYQAVATSSQGYHFAGDIGILGGYNLDTPDKLFRIRPSYMIPIAYPDLHIKTAFYLKRLRGGVFYDYGTARFDTWDQYSGAGIDVIADFHLLALPVPISAGLRTTYLTQYQELNFELIFSFDLTNY